MGELFTVFGATSGSTTSGSFALSSDIIFATGTAPFTLPTYIAIPYGMRVKIWGKRISGAPVTVTINYTKNITSSSPVWEPVDTEVLPSEGELDLEMDARPVVLRSEIGTEAVSFTWSQSTAGLSFASFDIEFTEDSG